MNETYFDLQTPPRDLLPREFRCRHALRASAEHLIQSAEHLAGAAPTYHEALQHSLRSIRQAYTALLEWHGLPPVAGAPLADLAAPAGRLVSALRTCWDVTFPIAPLEDAPSDGLPVMMREQAETSYYTARNTLAVVIGSLPERATREAIRLLNHAQAIRIGRIAPAPSKPRQTSKATFGRTARLHPGVTV